MMDASRKVVSLLMILLLHGYPSRLISDHPSCPGCEIESADHRVNLCGGDFPAVPEAWSGLSVASRRFVPLGSSPRVMEWFFPLPMDRRTNETLVMW